MLLGAAAIFIVYKAPKYRKPIQVVFGVLIVFLAVFLVARIMQPIKFKKERNNREEITVERLKDIRTAQEAYKDMFGKFTGNFDTLISFVQTDSFEIAQLMVVGIWNQDEMSQEEAIEQGLIRKSILKKSVRDSLFAKEFDLESIRYIPFTDNEIFVMGAGELETGSKVTVQVFEAYALYDILFNGMDRQMVVNYKDQRYKITEFEGVKVGSLSEANNSAGNWEK